MDGALDCFTRLRPRLLGLAYRMLGSLAEAEDVVQDVWLGWNETGAAQADDAEAWLAVATSRRAIDRLRRARAERARYVGLWLPEPVLTQDAPATPEDLHEAANDLSVAFLTVLERLAPPARAAFLLREAFDADYAQIARVLDKSEAACRQIVHRAKAQLREQQPRYRVPAQAHRRLMQRFLDAWNAGDLSAMSALMADSATLIGDGGGIVATFPEPMVGGPRIARLLFASTLRRERGLRLQAATINGRLGVLRYFGDALESAQAYHSDGERILGVYVQRNPHKLRRIALGATARLG
ncbi:RNA polymerase sigma factor, sigma-70 family [Lysobacter enzymogenes]|uniref:RNA polymerase sigma factor, sigma-70 family n=1 Tax=Lysobacter enzymogenes TaxID=69 RepID=A0A0S2DP04_LYSEN|nr:RNA polymerase sigma-70 factor [Lysobacter enzymogenes]ALN60266.1 RNA polymerase sigma factor, sigma-70 family [Lysobacter enzymogenes]QCW28236.1 RNA polymerase sigma-70 factor [Lysobacter enzymogenes]